ncbi:hypothetical protein ACFQ60_35335 [Streptomyces zhihengii]
MAEDGGDLGAHQFQDERLAVGLRDAGEPALQGARGVGAAGGCADEAAEQGGQDAGAGLGAQGG